MNEMPGRFKIYFCAWCFLNYDFTKHLNIRTTPHKTKRYIINVIFKTKIEINKILFSHAFNRKKCTWNIHSFTIF